ncbi:Chaperone DnaJ-domain superfamily protein, putative isoform 1 [Hibiscus syriacus]|uniref:Chaperone DnaJ-domain superfamily protein, putative isoform 1 n=1 Tax=Hibiscus syriacus TaxID=106335 RepID=A0A6A3ACE6_HIBSY|nr:Chaperone DnaJ-domain superfamily protein, putative isoform 1 [Hibiscus syriacus]
MDGNTTEAERWLSIAEKLLVSRDLHGTRTFAIRARETAPVLADQILAVTDTLLAAQSNPQDWYGILQLVPLTQSMEVVASQYRKLSLLLNYGKNGLSFADQAFRCVSEAWSVLSNTSKKAIYDNELRFLPFGPVSQFGQQYHHQQQQQQAQFQQPPQTQTLFMQPPPPKETQTLFMQQPPKETQTLFMQPPAPKETQTLFMQPPTHPPPKETQPLSMQPPAPPPLKETQTLFMQPPVPPPPKETQTLFMQTPKETQTLFAIRSPTNSCKDGNAAFEGGGQLGLNNNQPEATRPAESTWSVQMNQIGLAGPSQINPSGPVGSSHISRSEPTHTSQVNRPEPTQASQVNLPEPTRTSQVNKVGIASSSEFNRTEPIQRVEIKQKPLPPPPPPPPPPAADHTRTESNGATGRIDSTRPSQATESERPTFWTACPYCYILYEYPKMYEDCTLRCQAKNCRRAFHAVVIQPPPVNGNDTHFCCLGFFPLGFSGKDKNEGEIFDSSGPSEDDDDDDDEWKKYERKKKAKNAKGKGSAGRKPKKAPSETADKGSNQQVSAAYSAKLNGVPVAPEGQLTAESSRQGVTINGRKQMVKGAKSLGKLDLNVEFSNEVEEPVARRSEGNHAGIGEDDNIEGNGFFEGLDEFLSSLPILSNVGDEKVKST